MKEESPIIPTLHKTIKKTIANSPYISEKELYEIVHPILEKHIKQITKEIVQDVLCVYKKQNER